MKERFIDPDKIPPSLWQKETKKLLLPHILVDLWKGLLGKNGLLKQAENIAPSNLTGGISKKDTDNHLAWRYNGSCARVLLSLIDPNRNLSKISDAYASAFAGERVLLTDLPCGSGPAIITILCTLFELRKAGVLPRHPLNIKVLGGEISPTAREYLTEQLVEIKNVLEEQAIWIEFDIVEWDTLCKISTANLIKKINRMEQNFDFKVLMLSNFSGFLQNSGKWKKANLQFENIFLHYRDTNSIAIWIEPQKNGVIPFFDRVVKWFKSTFKALLDTEAINDEENWYGRASANCVQPIKKGDFPVNLTVARFNLPLEKKMNDES